MHKIEALNPQARVRGLDGSEDGLRGGRGGLALVTLGICSVWGGVEERASRRKPQKDKETATVSFFFFLV